MEGLPAGWTSVDDEDEDNEAADPDERPGEPKASTRVAPAAAAGISRGGERRTLMAIGGLVGLAVATALVVLASGAPQPTVLIGDQAAGAFLGVDAPAPSRSEPYGSASGARASTASSVELVIDVGGAVAHPGVYRLPPQSRLADALRAAGGFSGAVDVTAVERELNLAALLTDGTKVRVPMLGQPTAIPGAGSDAGASPGDGGSGAVGGPGTAGGGLVDLNHASAEALDALPGIGPVTAAKIIAAREERPFASVQELDDRGIVGPSTLAKLRDLVTVIP